MSAPFAVTAEETGWINAHPVITLSVNDRSAPKSFRDEKGALVGIAIDYVELLANRIGLRVRFEGHDEEQARTRALHHEVDGMIAVFGQDEDKSALIFSEPFAHCPQGLVVQKDYAGPMDLAVFSGKKLAVLKNSSQLNYLQKRYPGISVMPVSCADEALVLLSANKTDGVFGDLSVLHGASLRLSPGNIRMDAIQSDSAESAVCLGINNAEPVLRSLLNKAIASLTKADNQSIQDKWKVPDLSSLKGRSPKGSILFTDEECLWLHEHPVIRVAVSSDFVPVEFEERQGVFRGISMDYLDQLGELLHVRFEVIQNKTGRALMDMGIVQEADIVSGQGITLPETDRFIYTKPYFKLPIAIYVNKNQISAFRSLSELHGKTITLVSGSFLAERIKREHPEISILPASGLSEALEMIKNQNVDALVEDFYRVKSVLAKGNFSEIKLAAFSPFDYDLSFGIRKDWPQGVQIIDKALLAIPAEEQRLIRGRWLTYTPPLPFDIYLGWGGGTLCVLLVIVLLAKNYQLHVEVTRRSRALKKVNETLQQEITTRKQVENDGLRLEEQLAQAQKMESIGRLAGGVAHDFNNILAVILGHTELLTEDCPADSVLQENLEEIMEAGTRAQDLTRQLLAFSRKQVLEVKTLDLNKVISGMEKMLGRLLGEDIKVHLLLNAENSLIKGDISQLEQVLLNLCVNARDAMPDGGLITIETTVIPPMAHFTSVPHVSEFYIMLAVSDSGSGMDEAILGQIFDPFFTTKDKGKGTGLGLSTVYGIVKQHEGEITVHSEPGRGSTFRIYLPLVSGFLDEEKPELLTEALRGRGEIVLVVEDEAPVRKMVGQMLARLGYTVIEAGSADECITHATREEMIHLLLVDVVMPEMSGRQLHEHVHLLHPAMRTLFMSGYTDEIIQYHGMLKEDVHFISKPFTERKLGQKIREILDMNDRVTSP